ncbi:MAG: DUF4383 domain-containing protein [Actinomycetota bacterium]
MQARERTPAERWALGFGIFYLLLGLAGFAATGLSGATLFKADEGMRLLWILSVNGFHNIAHVAFGAALVTAVSVAASTGRPEVARGAMVGLGSVELIAALIGFTGAFVNFLNVPNGSAGLGANLFHLVTAVALMSVGFAPTDEPVGASPRPEQGRAVSSSAA